MQYREFAALVREALAHLYDISYLNRHPLSAVLASDARPGTGGQHVHRMLLEAIEHLRPPERVPPVSNAWRPYLVLSLRYAEEKTMEQIAQELGLSPRQLRREHARGLDMLTTLLWEKCAEDQTQSPTTTGDRSVTESEVARLSGIRSDSSASLAAVTETVLVTLERLAQMHSVRITTKIPQHLPPVHVERATLRQILLNVLTHVIETGGAGAIQLQAQRSANEVELAITHHGATSPTVATSTESSRLSVAEQLIRGQDGHMSLSTHDGLTITIALPLRPALVVLAIDDNPEMIELFRRYLGRGTYEIVGATTGPEGLRLAQEQRPAVIVLDVMMPDRDGWEILQNLRNLPETRDIPVIVCSVLKEQELATSLGASCFLAKPVTQQMLLTALDVCLTPSLPTRNPRLL